MAKPKSRIMKAIDELNAVVDEGKSPLFHQDQVILDRDNLKDLIDELRRTTPEEVSACMEVYARREDIISDARDEADRIRQEAREQADDMLDAVRAKTKEMLSENEIMMRAEENANIIIGNADRDAQKIIKSANEEAEAIVNDADNYANAVYSEFDKYLRSSLNNLQNIIEDCANETARNSNHLLEALRKSQDEIRANLDAVNNAGAESADNEDLPDDQGMGPTAPISMDLDPDSEE
ncbi:MAG: hypothetical protein K6A72_11120 [Lachnospiraceae bacterium]|nr:hypothetical protein [Lachnospiraceae bacterium]